MDFIRQLQCESLKLDSIIHDNLGYIENPLDVILLENLRDSIYYKKSLVLCYANKDFFMHLVLAVTLQQYFLNYQYDKDISKRVSVLLLTDKQHAVNYLTSLTLKSSEFFKFCFEKHNVFNREDLFCSLDNSYFSQCNWRHILNIYYKNNIPSYFPFHFALPISKGYKKFEKLSRGERNILGRKDDKQLPVFYITDNSKIFNEKLDDIDYFFVNHSYINKFVTNPPRNCIHFFNSPLDDRIQYYVKSESSLWNVDPKILMYQKSKFDNNIGTKNISDLIDETYINNIDVLKVSTDFDSNLENAISLISLLRKQGFYGYEIKLASYILYNAIKMPVSALQFDVVAEKEPICDTLYDSLMELKDSDHRFENNNFEILIQLIEDIFIKGKLDINSPKQEYLFSEINKILESRQTVGIIVSDKINSIALKDQISTYLNINLTDLDRMGIFFFDKNKIEVKDLPVCDHLLIYSAINLNELKILEFIKYKKATLILYNVELLSLKKKLSNLGIVNNEFLRCLDDVEGLKSLGIYKYLYNKIKKNLVDKNIEKIPQEIDELISPKGFVNVNRVEKEYKGKKAIKALLVEFNDNCFMFIDNTFKVNVLNKTKRENTKKSYRELLPGDEVIFIDHDVRQDIYHIFLNSMDKMDRNVYNYNKIEKWRMKYEEAFINRSLNDDELFKKMKKKGWDKVTKNILKNWRSGYSFGPRDYQDIVCLGEVLNIPDFVDNASEYHSAMSSIRVERILAAKLLNQIIYSVKRSYEEIADNLSKYNLTVEQLNEAIKIKKVKKIYNKKFYIKPIELGVLFYKE